MPDLWAEVPTVLLMPSPVAVSKDTLAWSILHIVSGGRRCVHLLCVGELAHQLQLEIFSPLILLPSVDEHFVLQRNDSSQRTQSLLTWGRGPSSAGRLME